MVAGLSVGIANSIVGLLAVDIAKTFFGSASPAAVASVSQLVPANSGAEIVFAFAMSVLAVRFRHKPLLLAGTIIVVISAVGSFFAPNLSSLQLLFALEGAGSIVVNIMMVTLIADNLPPDKKAKALGYIYSVGGAAALIIILLLGYITSLGGWRFGYLILAIPFSLAALILSFVVIPSKPNQQYTTKANPYVASFKQIFTNRSATAVLIANILTVAGAQVAIWAVAFYRTKFGLTREWTGLIYDLAIVLFIIAPLVAGRLVNRFGAKRLCVTSGFLAAVFVLVFFFVPFLWGALVLDMLHVWFASTALVAGACLVVDQVPNYRSTMVSLNNIFNSTGNAIAAAIGGALLYATNGIYGSVGAALGIMTIAGVAILFLFAKDPNRR